MKKALIFLACIFIVSGCTTAPKVVAPFDTSATIEASFDETWTKLVRFMSTNQIGIATIEKDSGLIVIDNQNLSGELISEYCDAAPTVPPLWGLYLGQVSGNVTVVGEGDFTTVSVNTRFRAVSRYGYSGETTVNPCNSLGMFEGLILDAVK